MHLKRSSLRLTTVFAFIALGKPASTSFLPARCPAPFFFAFFNANGTILADLNKRKSSRSLFSLDRAHSALVFRVNRETFWSSRTALGGNSVRRLPAELRNPPKNINGAQRAKKGSIFDVSFLITRARSNAGELHDVGGNLVLRLTRNFIGTVQALGGQILLHLALQRSKPNAKTFRGPHVFCLLLIAK